MKRIHRRETGDTAVRFPDSMHPMLQRIYAARSITSTDQLQHTLGMMHKADQLGGIDAACELLIDAVSNQRRIVIVGDFDADGATSTAVAVRALRQFGCEQVDYIVPNRFEYGYGLTPEIVEVAAKKQPDLLITVDNGISSVEGVAAAKERGMKVLITDHHLPGEQLPNADAIVNPNMKGDHFPSKNLAGVGVIFYILSTLRTRLREAGWFASGSRSEPNMASLLDLVCLGTVADVVPLDQNNRILVEQGLRRIRAYKCCAGISALLEIAGRVSSNLTATDLAFSVAPRLNAAGRLDDMSIGIECLLTDDHHRARELAEQLDKLNKERREIEVDMKDQALSALRSLNLKDDQLPPGICLFSPDWHQGVIGILASRIKEKFNRPVVVFAQSDEGVVKGSARSIPGFHIRDALDTIASGHPKLIQKFGGHAMAAGLTMEQGNYGPFQTLFAEQVRRQFPDCDFTAVVESDGELLPNDLNLKFAELLRDAGPWGQCFPEPLFDGIFEVDQKRIVGERHLKMLLIPEKGQQLIDGIAFNQPYPDWLSGTRNIRIAYRLDVNEYRGRRNPQLIIEHMEPA